MTRKTSIEVIIGVLAIVSVILIAVESLLNVSEQWLVSIYILDFIICIVFALDFAYRFRIAQNKTHFLKVNGYEILAMIPAAALNAAGSIPAISAGLRSLRLIRVVRVVVAISRMRRVATTSSRFLQRSHLVTMLAIMAGTIFIAAFAVLVLETGTPSAQITNFSDAIWWSISTVTTVGYGDIVPNSSAGRIIGMILMLFGIGVMASLISQVSATLVESRIKKDASKKDDLRTNMIAEIKNRIDNIDLLTESEMSLLIQMIQTLKVDK